MFIYINMERIHRDLFKLYFSRLFSFGGYGLALAALSLVVFGAYDSYPFNLHTQNR